MDGLTHDTMATSSSRKCSAITGSARKIKDNMADWHNLMLKWEKLNDTGFNIITNISNMRLSQSSQSSSSSSSLASADTAADLQDQCSKLREIVDKMVAIVKKMERLMTSQRGLQDLEDFQFGPEGRKVPLFHTWSTQQFVASSDILCEAFQQEVKLKQVVLQEVAHSTNSDLCTVYLSCWLHQPFIPAHVRQTLEALLLETGHRPL
ncbi:cyclin-dependent kinase 2-interacting protein [Cynoglossus semilaevis]|uniref:cyclin-dependent kinase 2-interacting protein n=1 Tax=Cynoglossus semilaevis TaxID=244447 RepID=UPI000497CBD7|nr:cyclin-dependent kinase 2-interacting protein [Cynoglossus semilaevis]XP_024912042.1 cyclin-dependent kinase 2-interacting protein [Cynoglossus semilaevis]